MLNRKNLTFSGCAPTGYVGKLIHSMVHGWHASWHDAVALCRLGVKCQNGNVIIDGGGVVAFVFSHFRDSHTLSDILTQSMLSDFDSKVTGDAKRTAKGKIV